MKHESVLKDSPEDGPVTTRHWRQKVVLLLSNDPWLQESIRRALPPQIEIMPVLHSEQATRLAKKEFINAVLLDLDLGTAGWRTAEKLLAEDAPVPLLLLIQPGLRPELAAAVRAGILLEKPVDGARLLQALTTLFSQSKLEHLQHNASQHNFLRYAHPLSWLSEGSLTQRHWGLNE
jgi:DNA-binding response OmpR family regulator